MFNFSDLLSHNILAGLEIVNIGWDIYVQAAILLLHLLRVDLQCQDMKIFLSQVVTNNDKYQPDTCSNLCPIPAQNEYEFSRSVIQFWKVFAIIFVDNPLCYPRDWRRL